MVIGGSYLKSSNIDSKIDNNILNNILKTNINIKDFKEWYLIKKTDPYFLNNRVRRFTNSGSILILNSIEQRKPFFANKLIELIYSLPDNLRYKNYIYRKMLLKFYPKYFYTIPWQKTGYPISYSDTLLNALVFKDRVVKKLRRKSKFIGIKEKDQSNLADYAKWIRQEPAKSIFNDILLNKKAIYPKYISKLIVQTHLKEHMDGKSNYQDNLCLALTFEIWLQQIFKNKPYYSPNSG